MQGMYNMQRETETAVKSTNTNSMPQNKNQVPGWSNKCKGNIWTTNQKSIITQKQ